MQRAELPGSTSRRMLLRNHGARDLRVVELAQMKTNSWPAQLIAGLLTTLTPLVPLRAATLLVCPSNCPYTKIQDAVEAAASGDVIRIAAGHYGENVKIAGKTLKLVGARGGADGITEVDGGGHGPVFTLGSGADEAYQLIELQHLTITHGGHESGSGMGGGVQVRRGAYLHLSQSTVTQNTARFGGGISVNTPGGPASTVTHCLIDDNQAVVEDFLNGSDGQGGGIEVAQDSIVTIEHSTIVRNQALNGGGLYSDTGSHLTVDSTTFTENQVAQVHVHRAFVGGVGGGLAVNSNVTITNSTIADNAASGPEGGLGGGLFILLGGRESIATTIIAHNVAGGGNGGGIFTAAASNTEVLTLDYVYIVENQAAADAPGGVANEGTLVLRHTTIKDNAGINCSGGIGCP